MLRGRRRRHGFTCAAVRDGRGRAVGRDGRGGGGGTAATIQPAQITITDAAFLNRPGGRRRRLAAPPSVSPFCRTAEVAEARISAQPWHARLPVMSADTHCSHAGAPPPASVRPMPRATAPPRRPSRPHLRRPRAAALGCPRQWQRPASDPTRGWPSPPPRPPPQLAGSRRAGELPLRRASRVRHEEGKQETGEHEPTGHEPAEASARDKRPYA